MTDKQRAALALGPLSPKQYCRSRWEAWEVPMGTMTDADLVRRILRDTGERVSVQACQKARVRRGIPRYLGPIPARGTRYR